MKDPIVSEMVTLDPLDYYHLPWTVTDNGMSWLEVTTKCNIACRGCYRDPKKEGHKSLEQIREELAVFKETRCSDGMSIAGGDPLLHPQIVDIVQLISDMGWKPQLQTNGLSLNPELLRALKKAGAASFTFHIDTTQKRRDGSGKSELDFGPLRRKFAEMIAAEGGMTCGFNTTITRSTLDEVAPLTEWAEKNADVVHSLHFILYRDFAMAPHLDMYVGGKEYVANPKYVDPEYTKLAPVSSRDIVNRIRTVSPDFEPSSYLSGTVDPKSMKWILAQRFVLDGKTIGYAGPRFMEVTQSLNHLIKGKWLGVSHPKIQAAGKPILFGTPFDRGVRAATRNFLKEVIREPRNLLKKVQMQTILVVQGVDFLEDGQLNMCSGCPDMTVHEGKLYWSCRLEEIKEHGMLITAAPKVDKQTEKAEPAHNA